jgi:tRNA nucleotidyltransferase (CCA-adding enzyme)
VARYQLREIFDKAIEQIRPAQESFIEVDEIIKEINRLLKKNNIKAVCVAGGSYAKGTILKDDFDVDLFVRFDTSYKDEELSKLLGEAIASLKPMLIHGSRDYYQLKKKDLLFEIIPVLMINDYKKAVNVTDMSPLHVAYARSHFDKKPGLTDQVRLTKQFCKAAKVYGAESYIRGFSGHVLDLLIIYYGGFENLMMQASVWGERVIVDIENHLKDPLKELNSAKTESPLIIVDPIQPDRNAAAALSEETFSIFKQKAKEFLENPSEEFFTIKKLNVEDVKKRVGLNWIIVLDIIPTNDSEDIAGTKLLKCHEKIIRELRDNEFNILEADWEFEPGKGILCYVIKKEELSKNIMLEGPPISAKANAKKFKEKHAKVTEQDRRLYAEEKRPYMTPVELVSELIKTNYFRERTKEIKVA